jgi:class 3 adenylate cyclase
MFGDTAGFSRLREAMLRQYRKLFFGSIADTLREYGDDVLSSNSWGDAIYLVMAEPARAARCAIDIQENLHAIDFAAHGFEQPLRLRLSLHYGPVFPGTDELTGAHTYFGKEVTFAARMEPVTPPGEVYATEELASQLALAGETAVAADYVGTVELAKQYGTAPMYLLRRAQAAER